MCKIKSVETTKGGVIEERKWGSKKKGVKRETKPLDSNPVTVDFEYSFPKWNERMGAYIQENKVVTRYVQ